MTTITGILIRSAARTQFLGHIGCQRKQNNSYRNPDRPDARTLFPGHIAGENTQAQEQVHAQVHAQAQAQRQRPTHRGPGPGGVDAEVIKMAKPVPWSRPMPKPRHRQSVTLCLHASSRAQAYGPWEMGTQDGQPALGERNVFQM